jgi:hypothetical protein
MVMGLLPQERLCVFWDASDESIGNSSIGKGSTGKGSTGSSHTHHTGVGGSNSSSGDSGRRWECSNDGSCVPSVDPVRARWGTQDACFKECGQGKWACTRPSPTARARAGAHHCTPDPLGRIEGGANGSAAVCEAQCH